MCDIDDFKKINDSFGHLAGDHVIKAVANCLNEQLRESDLIARYGGEEFAIILPHSSSESAYDIAERLREKIATLKIKYEKQLITFTMSFGIASCQGDEKISVDELIRRADKALYKAKSAGKNQSVVAGRKKSKIIRFFRKKSISNKSQEKRICNQ